MKIIELKAENVKRLKAVEIIPEGNTVIISGRNGQGKTSVLDAIWLALGGGNAAKDSQTTRPVRDGEKKASVSLDLGEIKITRSWTSAGNMTLKVESQDGTPFKSPQALLDGMVGKLSFDPLAFSRMSPADQRKTLIGLVDLGFDPDELDAERKRIYEERTTLNRELKSLEAQITGKQKPAPDTPDEELSLKELIDEAQAANAKLAENNALRRLLQEKRTDAAALRDRIVAMKEEIKKLELELEEKKQEGKDLVDKVETLADPSLDEINGKIADIEGINARVRETKSFKELSSKASDLRKQADAKSTEIDALDKKKAEALRNAAFPIAGLGFDEEGVLFDGVPFAQCSAAERMKASLAIAAALNPKIRIIRVNDGSLLDSESMVEVERMAEERDMQIWIERVDETGKVGIVIEDGEIAENRSVA